MGATYRFAGGRALKLLKNGVNITNSTSSLRVTKNITLTVLDCCVPPSVRLVVHCIGCSFGGTPKSIGSAIHLISEIYEKC